MTSRAIPEEIKRIVRRRSGFGCVICGLPIFDYEHIEEFSVEQAHDDNNIVLLCPLHHAEKTRKRLDKAVIRRAAANPVNLSKDRTAGHVHLMVGDQALFEVGGNKYEFSFGAVDGRFDAIRIGAHTVLGLSAEDGCLLLDVSLTDQVGVEVLRIERGEMTISTGVWDYRIVGPTVTINSAERMISLEMDFVPQGVIIRRGMFVRPPVTLLIEPHQHQIFTNGSPRMTMSGSTMRQCRVGMQIG